MSTCSKGISERALKGSPDAFAFFDSLNISPVAVTLGLTFPVTTTSPNATAGLSKKMLRVLSVEKNRSTSNVS